MLTDFDTRIVMDWAKQTKAELKEKAQSLLKKGKAIISKKSPDFDFVLWMLKRRRPRLKETVSLKVDIGIDGITNAFYYKTEKMKDWEDFSYKKAITNKPVIEGENYTRNDIIGTLRNTVAPDLKAFKHSVFKANNALKKLHEQNPFAVQADHVIPFMDLVDYFLGKEGLQLEQLKITKKRRNDTYHYHFLDPDLEKQWLFFHNYVGEFEIVTAQENLRRKEEADKLRQANKDHFKKLIDKIWQSSL